MTEIEPAGRARLKSPFFRATILLPSYTRLAAPWPAETSGVRMVNADFEIPRSVLVGETADVYLQRGLTILRNEGVNPVVAIEFSPQRAGVLCGIAEVRGLLSRVLPDSGSEVWALEEGESVAAGEVALRVKAPYGSIGLYETAISGILAQSTGFASAARECVGAASGKPVIALGARHVHPEVAGILGYCAVIGGCVSCSTIQGSRLSGITPAGNMPHSLSLIMGGAVQAIEAFDRHMPQEVPRVALVDTFRDEAEEAISVARSLGEKLRGIRMNTPRLPRRSHPRPRQGSARSPRPIRLPTRGNHGERRTNPPTHPGVRRDRRPRRYLRHWRLHRRRRPNPIRSGHP